MKIKAVVIDLLNEQLNIETKIDQQMFEERTYLRIVDKLPAGCMAEEIAEAASKLYDKLLEVEFYNDEPMKQLSTYELDGLLMNYIRHTFNRGVEMETVMSEFANCGYHSVTTEDVERCMAELLIDEDWI